ncbi:hypothetical protein D3C74_399830 [compost metagenome]
MTRNIIRIEAPSAKRFKVSNAGGNKRRLRIHRLLKIAVRTFEYKLAQRKSEYLVAFFKYGTALRQCVIYILTHPNCLRTLTGKDKCDFTHEYELLPVTGAAARL